MGYIQHRKNRARYRYTKGQLKLKVETFQPKGDETYREAFITIIIGGIRQQTFQINDEGRIMILESKKDTVEFV